MFTLKTNNIIRGYKKTLDKGNCIFKQNGIIKIICRNYWPINNPYSVLFIIIYGLHQCMKVINKYIGYRDKVQCVILYHLYIRYIYLLFLFICSIFKYRSML